ncbi:hypothetical protein NHX12_015114 [Muraenolepis orangiensis]|uniref:Apoptotic chromatin condensation inducer in the nucleus n=1 Tax=Muraenolepis orangiensis TaxID=630683 RepID=A0A9Q0I3K4_9TELE|nr:hypothetical protein NHX12_015114 [Muraenolepis orangiensis]
MSQNSFIKQYLATQQELMRQKLEKEAQQASETDESSSAEEAEEHSDRNDDSSFTPDKQRYSVAPQPVTALRPEPEGCVGPQEAPEAPGARPQWSSRPQPGPSPSPSRAVASLTVRVVGEPDRRGPHKEGVAPSEPGSARNVLHLNSDEDDSDDDDDDSEGSSDEEEESWEQGGSGPAPAQLRPQQLQQQACTSAAPAAAPAAPRSRRKLQPPQHIPPPRAHPAPMQLRHPTPPPSPPPELSFPLPDTPNSPEPPRPRGAGPLARLAHKIDAERGQPAAGEPEAVDMPTEGGRGTEKAGEGNKRPQKKEEEEKMEVEATRPAEKEEQKTPPKQQGEAKESQRHLPPWKRGRVPAGAMPATAKRPASTEAALTARDSGSDSSSREKPRPAKLTKCKQTTTARLLAGSEPGDMLSEANKSGEVSESSEAPAKEAEPDAQSSAAAAQEPASEAKPANGNGSLEEISLTSNKTAPPSGADGAAGESETTGGGATAAGRKRRWGSSAAVTTKKPSISITTDSLKSLIPDIKMSQEVAVDLHPDDLQLSDARSHRSSQGRRRSSARGRDTPLVELSPGRQEAEAQKVTPSDSVVRRSISQQKSGMSVTIDDTATAPGARHTSPPRGKLSGIVHVSNLVRPFTLGQLKELLGRTGTMLEEGFWIDKIKSHCYVTYATTEEAQATRSALHALKWPPSNPKVLSVDFSQQDELDFHRGTLKPQRTPEKGGRERGAPRDQWAERGPMGGAMRDPWAEHGGGGPPGGGGGGAAVRDQWAEREREMQRREQARCEREWDRDKIRDFGHPGGEGEEEVQRSREREREHRRRDRAKSKERKSDKKDEPPAKLLDDLFLKTKAAPCIYWLPLNEEQVAQKALVLVERQKEREKKRKEQEEEDDKRKAEERKERQKAKEAKEAKEAAGAGGGGGGSGSGGGGGGGGGSRELSGPRRGADGAREADRKRDGFRPGGPSRGAMGGGGGGGGGSGGGPRRSRSRSNPRARRR